MIVDNRAFVQLELEALSVRYFVVKYSELERKVKDLFRQNISSISGENRQLLYFYLAGIKCSAHIEYGINALKTDDVRFLANEKFAQFSLSQIIKIQRHNHLLTLFEFNIPSLNRTSTEYTFSDCCVKLLSMRNKLAHEISHLSFDDKDIIELLSNEYIRNNSSRWFSSLDTELMNDETKYIFSNVIIMDQIMTLLCEREVDNEH